MKRNHLALAAIAGCPMFPSSSQWNQPVDKLPVHASSDAIVRSIGVGGTVHPDFGSGLYEGMNTVTQAPRGCAWTTSAPARRARARLSWKRPKPTPLGRAANHADSVVTLRPPILASLPGASVSLEVICSPASEVATTSSDDSPARRAFCSLSAGASMRA